MKEVKINIIFKRDAIGFENFQPLIEELYPFVITHKSEHFLSFNYENIRYLFPEMQIQNKKLSITSGVTFDERIRFYQFDKVNYPVNLLCDLVFELLHSHKDTQYTINLLDTSNLTQLDERVLKRLLMRIAREQPANLRLRKEHSDFTYVDPIPVSLFNEKFISRFSDLKLDEIRSKFELALSLGFHEDSIRFGNLYVEKNEYEDFDVRMYLGLAYVMFYMPEKGEEQYQFILSNCKDPKTLANVLYCLSMLYARHHHSSNLNAEIAENYLYRAQKLIEDNKDTLSKDYEYLRIFNRNGRALLLFRKKDIETAHFYCENGYRSLFNYYGPTKHVLHRTVLIYNCTMTSRAMQDYDRTKLYFDMLLSIDPWYADYWYDQAKLYSHLNDVQESILSLSKAIELNGYNPSYYIERAGEYIKVNDYALAKQDFESALRLEPDNIDSLINYSAMLLEQGCGQAALKILDKAYLPDDPYLLNNKGLAYMECGQLTEAVQVFQRSIELNNTNPEPYANLSICLYKLTQYDKSLASMKRAADLEPDNDNYKDNINFILNEIDVLQTN